MSEKITHRIGALIGLSSGDYSDYIFQGLYRCLRDLHLPSLGDEYRATLEDRVSVQNWHGTPHEYHYKYPSPTSSGFGAFLIRGGYVEEVDYDEIHGDDWSSKDIASQCQDIKAASIGLAKEAKA